MPIQQLSTIHSSFGGRNITPLNISPSEFEGMGSADGVLGMLAKLGIVFDASDVDTMVEHAQSVADRAGVPLNFGFGMDAAGPVQQGQTAASIAAPVQFLQFFLPGIVHYLTGARQIDTLVGRATVGDWADDQIVQRALEPTGAAVPYGDLTNVPYMNYNPVFVSRSIVQYEAGFMVAKREEMRAAKAGFNSPDEKRRAASLALDIARNDVGFYGFNGGLNATYGFLNDPNLPSYITVAATGTGSTTTWSTKTTLQIISDILTALQALRTGSKNVIDVKKTPITLAVAMSSVDYLSTPTDLGYSVQEWLTQNYPNVRVESAPQLDAANAGANVFYLYADNVGDGSTDGGATFIHMVPTAFMLVGVAQQAKGYEEDYTNATAGVMCKRPFAVVRRSGI